MLKRNKLRWFEIGLYIFIGIVACIFPIVMYETGNHDKDFLFRDLIRLLPFLTVFLINNFLLCPKLLFKQKYTSYILSCIGLILLVVCLSGLFHKPMAPFEKVPESSHIHMLPVHPKPSKPMPLMFNFGMFIICFLIIGFNTGIKIFIKWAEEQNLQAEKERQYLTAELAFLKHQISPHFFMNTLNNIHALIGIDTEQAQDSVIKLSKLMRHLLYEADTETTPLRKEIAFLESYIELMRLRYDETKLSITTSYAKDIDQIQVPTLLFLPLVENAFKHGVGTERKSFIDIRFEIDNNNLRVAFKNSNFAKKSHTFDEKSGIGLENIRKRLEILYKGNFRLDKEITPETFEIIVTIPIG